MKGGEHVILCIDDASDVRPHASELGMAAVFQKPIDPARLIVGITAWLNESPKDPVR